MNFRKYAEVILFATITILFSFSPWLTLWQMTPPGKIFTGPHWWTDYYAYLGFLENGVRGSLTERFLISITPQSIWIHGIYTFSGYLLGKLNIDSITIYHLDRLLLGSLFIVLVYFFYRSIFKNKFYSIVASIFVFWIPGFSRTQNFLNPGFTRPLDGVQQFNILTRAGGLPHYTFSSIFVILAVWFFLNYKKSFLIKTLILTLLSWIFIIANPVNAMIYYFILFVYFIFSLILNFHVSLFLKDKGKDCLVVIISFISNVPLFIYYYKALSSFPWGQISNVFNFFIGNIPLPIFELILALGPILIFSFLGSIVIVWKKMRGEIIEDWTIFFLSWALAQWILYFLANKLGMENYRFIQSLYYIPMAGLTVYALKLIVHLWERLPVIYQVKRKYLVILLVLLSYITTTPTLSYSYREHLVKYNNGLTYISKKEYAAYKFLEKNSPFASVVLAEYTPTVLLPGMSGNSVKLDFLDKTKIQKTDFFSNKLLAAEAKAYLKENNISYIWVGSEEHSRGFRDANYPFLHKIFQNGDVDIYQVP